MQDSPNGQSSCVEHSIAAQKPALQYCSEEHSSLVWHGCRFDATHLFAMQDFPIGQSSSIWHCGFSTWFDTLPLEEQEKPVAQNNSIAATALKMG